MELRFDWREALKSIIEKKYKSRYKFCKAVNFDQGYLSNILNGKRSLSIDNLLKILDALGYEMFFRLLDIDRQTGLVYTDYMSILSV